MTSLTRSSVYTHTDVFRLKLIWCTQICSPCFARVCKLVGSCGEDEMWVGRGLAHRRVFAAKAEVVKRRRKEAIGGKARNTTLSTVVEMSL